MRQDSNPIGSMGLVYLPTFTIKINHSCRWIYQTHGLLWECFFSSFEYIHPKNPEHWKVARANTPFRKTGWLNPFIGGSPRGFLGCTIFFRQLDCCFYGFQVDGHERTATAVSQVQFVYFKGEVRHRTISRSQHHPYWRCWQNWFEFPQKGSFNPFFVWRLSFRRITGTFTMNALLFHMCLGKHMLNLED